MNKLSIKLFNNLELFERQGGSWAALYKATYNGTPVIIKTQKPGSLHKTNPKDDRFILERDRLGLNITGVVKCFGWGDNFDGERFLVLEQLKPLSTISDTKIQGIANTILLADRKLYLHGFTWVPVMKHLGLDSKNNIKVLDLNDDVDLNIPYFGKERESGPYNIKGLIFELCRHFGGDPKTVWNNAVENLIREEYLSLENAHQPIPIKEYEHFLRTETEENDPNFGKPVPANRNCYDRLDMISKAIEPYKGNSVLDIGTNIGWFCFELEKLGYKATGIDLDLPASSRPKEWRTGVAGKIAFAKMLGELLEKKNLEFYTWNVTNKSTDALSEHDIVLNLSLLHLYFSQHKVSKQWWFEMMDGLFAKTRKVFIFEARLTLLDAVGATSFEDLAQKLADRGGFTKIKFLGRSDNRRHVIMLER